MGNLYTQYKTPPSHRLSILSKLKFHYRCTPRDWNEINRLKKELDKVDNKRG